MANPRLAPTAAAVNPFSSPDIIVRPQANPTNAPTWQLPGTTKIHAGNVPAYQLWTFQTAFRWLYPSIAADGQWTDQFADLVQLHRTVLALPAGRFIDRALWNAVVVNSHVAANGTVTAVATDPRAVYRAPWQSAMSLDAVATEVDLTELVVPPRDLNDVWQVYAEPSTVDVLIHHRDVRPLPANNAFAILLWRSAPTSAALLSTTVAGLPAFVASLATATPLPTPGGWNLVTPGAGATVHALRVPVDARMPRAVPIDVDLSGVTTTPNGHRVLLLAVVGSTRDPLTTPPTGAPATVVDLVKAWPNAAMRLVRVSRRPA
jgi:hypothetical protein